MRYIVWRTNHNDEFLSRSYEFNDYEPEAWVSFCDLIIRFALVCFSFWGLFP